jgi:nucleoside-diphosphate-sugar epimerase
LDRLELLSGHLQNFLATGDSLQLSTVSENVSVLIEIAAARQCRCAGSEEVPMRVFVTGATGFIGSAIVKELIGAGHKVLGMARSHAGAKSLEEAGAQVQRGDLEDPETLRSGAAAGDAVVHTAFIHDFSKFQENCEIDRRAIEAIGEALAGTKKLFIVTSGLGVIAQSGLATEADPPIPVGPAMPRASEAAAVALATRGVRTQVVRLPQVHDTTKQGLVSYLIRVAREKGVSAYLGDGSSRWAAVHRLDVAHLYRLALEKNEANARYHAVAEEGVLLREIAEAIGKGLHVPVVSIAPEAAAGHFGFLAHFAGLNLQGSSAETRKKLGWNPTGPTLLTDLANMRFAQD